MLASESDQLAFAFEKLLWRGSGSKPLKFRCLACGNMFEASHHDGWHKP